MSSFSIFKVHFFLIIFFNFTILLTSVLLLLCCYSYHLMINALCRYNSKKASSLMMILIFHEVSQVVLRRYHVTREGNIDCCSWDGIECSENIGHVFKLNLSNNCLQGSIGSNVIVAVGFLKLKKLTNNWVLSSHFNPCLIRELSKIFTNYIQIRNFRYVSEFRDCF